MGKEEAAARQHASAQRRPYNCVRTKRTYVLVHSGQDIGDQK